MLDLCQPTSAYFPRHRRPSGEYDGKWVVENASVLSSSRSNANFSSVESVATSEYGEFWASAFMCAEPTVRLWDDNWHPSEACLRPSTKLEV